jgi:hypothetical protein
MPRKPRESKVVQIEQGRDLFARARLAMSFTAMSNDVMQLNVVVVGAPSLTGALLPLIHGFPCRGEWLRLKSDADSAPRVWGVSARTPSGGVREGHDQIRSGFAGCGDSTAQVARIRTSAMPLPQATGWQ